jgi:2,3-bisphosphoglycerate-independent phosphoglycerate mutase
LRARFRAKDAGGRPAGELVDRLLREESVRQHYAIWAADTPYLFRLRREFPTVITTTCGPAAGYEEVEPKVQGNSETGHQQLGNLIVAAQPAREITLSIESGNFFENAVLREAVAKARDSEANLNVCTLLSGERGDDGRVHSCWNHLEAFLRLCFDECGLPPSKLRIQAILDGRDSPSHASVEGDGDQLNFMAKLVGLLRRYDAEDALAWVIGRSIGMDRDYVEARTKADYELLTKGEGVEANGYDGAVAAIKEMHENDCTDAYVEAICVCDRQGTKRTVSSGDVFVDLNFRADRQRAKIAALLGAREFLEREASLKGSTWKMDWMDEGLEVHAVCLTEYHPDLTEKHGAKVAFPTKAHAHNYLELASRASERGGFSFNYLLLAESTKALHVGYFVRGRREEVSVPGCEERMIVPSYGEALGVKTDDDYYKTPQMKAFEIAGVLANEMYRRHHDLIFVNFSNPDMIGHLIMKHFGAVVECIEVMNTLMGWVIPLAGRLGYTVIVTADHGNADDYSPKHGSHDVLTTFVPSTERVAVRSDLREKARLFDLPWCVLDILGITESVRALMPEVPAEIEKAGLVGRSLVRCG